MATRFDSLAGAHKRFIEKQKIFFVGSAAPEGRVNVSPKGMDSLRVLGPNRIVWLNLTGSGNETAGHLLQANRMTLMWCAFDGPPMILRAYGAASVIHKGAPGWDEAAAPFPPAVGARQVFDMTVDLVQTSCGYAVPRFDHVEDREVLTDWAERRGEDGIRAYWAKKNQQTLDGAPTGIPVDDA